MIHFTATHPKCKKRRFSQIIRLGHNWLEKRCTNWVLESIIHVEVSHGSLFVDFEALWLLKAHVVYAKSRSLQKIEMRRIVDHLRNGQPTSFLFPFSCEVKVKSSCWTTHAKIASSETVSHQMRRHDGSSYAHKVSTTIMPYSKWSQYIFGSPIIWYMLNI